jgi:hypothetical protein
MEVITDWIRNELINQSDVQLEINEEIMNKIDESSYN